MYQGETITIRVGPFPVSLSEIENVHILFKSNSKIILEKTSIDCTVVGEVLECKLSQEETLTFPTGTIKQSTIVITKDGSRFESDPCNITCGKTAKNEVLS